jgi:hypothetical protein
MKKIIVLIGIMVNVTLLNAQKSYHVSYNKSQDSYKFFENKLVQGKTEKVELKNKFPKLKENDIVTIEVTNYNPFKYYVSISEDWKTVSTGKKSGASGILNLITMGLNPFSSFLQSIPIAEDFARGDESTSLVENAAELDLYQTQSSEMLASINVFLEQFKEFQGVLENLQEEDIESQKEMIISKLKKCASDYVDPLSVIENLYPSAKYHFFRAGVANSELLDEEKEADNRINKFKEDKVLMDAIYSKEKIYDLIQQLNSAKFSCERKYQVKNINTFKVDDPANDELQNDDVAIGKLYTISFYNIQELKDAAIDENSSDQIVFLRFYHPNRYWTIKGEITDSICRGCKPVISAEGLWRNGYDVHPRNLFEIYIEERDIINYKGDDGPSPSLLKKDAVGNWNFYDKNGKLEHISVAPSRSENSNADKKDGVNPTFDDYLLEDKIAQRKIVELPVKGAINMNWSSGIYSVGSFATRNKYSTQYVGVDSITIVGAIQANMKFCFGSQMDFQFYGNGLLTPSINVGAAIDFTQERNIQFLLGGGLKFKKFPLLGLTGGIAFTPNQVLTDTYKVGVNYDYFTFDSSAYFKRKYQLGYFIGLNLNF